MRSIRRSTFNQIVEAAREQAAGAAWTRATAASRLRKALTARRHFQAARRCAAIKCGALERAASVLPDAIKITIDDVLHVGLTSVRWRGHGGFHLPADALLNAAAPTRASA